MRSFPHKPDAAILAAMNGRLAKLVEKAGDEESPDFLLRRANRRSVRAHLDYGENRTVAEVAKGLRAGLRDLKSAIEWGHPADPWEIWNALVASSACGDRASAQFFASLPPTEAPATLEWLNVQIGALVALMSGLEPRRSLEALRLFLFDSPVASGLRADLPQLQATCVGMESVMRSDAGALNRMLMDRLEASKASGRNCPLRLLDLEALALCRLARDRGMQVTVQHVCLPLDLLDVR